jgi:heme-degrading monooxygenase HmoA
MPKIVDFSSSVENHTRRSSESQMTVEEQMVGVHVEFHIRAGQEQKFLNWKIKEGEMQVKAPGFIKRSMSQSVENPNIYYYVSYWSSTEQMRAFADSPEFAKAQQETGVHDATEVRNVVNVTEVFDDKGERPNG